MIASAKPNHRAKGHRTMNTLKEVPVAVAPLTKRGAAGAGVKTYSPVSA